MSNTKVQYLQKQVARKDAQILVLLEAFESLSSENEFLASVACGFAWDLVVSTERSQVVEHSDPAWNAYENVRSGVEERWDEAVAAAQGQMTATEIALRDEAGIK